MEIVDKAIKDSIRQGERAFIKLAEIHRAGVSVEDVLNAVDDVADRCDLYSTVNVYFGKTGGKRWVVMVEHPSTVSKAGYDIG